MAIRNSKNNVVLTREGHRGLYLLEPLSPDENPKINSTGKENRTIALRRCLGFLVGCLALTVVGSKMIFNVYQNDIKDIFNYTQSEVAVMASMLNIGGGTLVIPGIIFDKFGPRWTSFAGLFLSSSGHLLIWSTTQMATFYQAKSWLMSIYFLIAGLGTSCLYIASLNTNIINFPENRRATIVGVLQGFLIGSAILYIILYYMVFSNGGREELDPYVKYSTFMLVLLGLSLCAGVLSLIFLRNFEPAYQSVDEAEQESSLAVRRLSICSDSSQWNKSHEGKIKDERKRETPLTVQRGTHILKDVKFILFSCTFVLLTLTSIVYITNITTTTHSMHYNQYEFIFVLITPVVDPIAGVIVGYLYDRTFSSFWSALYMVYSAACFLVCGLISTFAADSFASFVIATIANAIATGIVWSASPVYLAHVVGMPKFGTYFGALTTLSCFLGLAAQVVFGETYDAQINATQGITCYGKACVQGGYCFLLGLHSIAFIISACFAFKSRGLSQVKI